MIEIPTRMTEEQFLSLPDREGIERELIRGELRERPESIRDFAHGVLTASIGCRITLWLDEQPRPRGRCLAGPVAIRLRRDPTTIVGADIAYISAGSVPRDPHQALYVDGPPALAIEILSPNDTNEIITDKIEVYLDAGVPLVWLVEPRYSTVTVYRPDAKPQLFNADQEITAGPSLPGFRVAVADLFEDLD